MNDPRRVEVQAIEEAHAEASKLIENVIFDLKDTNSTEHRRFFVVTAQAYQHIFLWEEIFVTYGSTYIFKYTESCAK